MIVGFTGTQVGMTPEQMAAVREALANPNTKEFHHGDCIGADEEAHNIAVEFHIPIFVHPPVNPNKQAFCREGFHFEPRPYLIRNHDIVDACNLLIATPRGPEELRSGTWATIRYASKIGRQLLIIEP